MLLVLLGLILRPVSDDIQRKAFISVGGDAAGIGCFLYRADLPRYCLALLLAIFYLARLSI
jgi:hypothetical protein